MTSPDPIAHCGECPQKLCRYLADETGISGVRVVEMRRGDRLETPGNACLKLWTVTSGSIAVCNGLPDGRRQISALEWPGSTICGAAATIDNPVWLEALEPSKICEMDFSGRMRVLGQDAGFLAMVFNIVHARLEVASRHLTTLGRLDSTERVTLFLAEMAKDAEGRGTVQLRMSRDDIADYLGLNAETVSRILSRLRKSGLFRFLSPTEYTVPDMKAVERRLPVQVHAHLGDSVGLGADPSRKDST